VASFNSTLPFSFGADFCAGDTTMRSIFAGCQIQLSEFMAARARLAGDKSMLDFMPAVRADKLALGLHDIADSIYKLAANWRSLIASAQAAIGSEANKLTNARNTLSADDVRYVRDDFKGLSRDAQRAWLRDQIAANDRKSLIAVLSAPKSIGLLDDKVRAAVERQIAGDSYDALTDRRTAIQCAREAVDRLVSFVRSETNIQSDPRATISSDSQG
jgi:hypothetical protein